MPGRKYEVLLTAGAEQDLESIYDYIAEFDGKAKADHVLDRLLEAVESLSTFPERGVYPKELIALGIRDYRQTVFKPYRVIYRVIGQKDYIYVIADGRRDMQSLLTRRLLGARWPEALDCIAKGTQRADPCRNGRSPRGDGGPGCPF
jgi:toxin ParE1/3/4